MAAKHSDSSNGSGQSQLNPSGRDSAFSKSICDFWEEVKISTLTGDWRKIPILMDDWGV